MSNEINYSTSALIATTTGGLEMPVFYDPHTQIYNSKPPASVITGSPGSGKTFLALTLTAISTIMGKTTIVLDPKGDFLSLMNIKEDIGSFELWNLMDNRNKGILDPFNMANTESETLSLVLETIELFMGGLSDDQLTALSPIVQDVMAEKTPSLARVVSMLRSSRNKIASNMGYRLDMISKMNFAKLCFAPASRVTSKVKLSGGLTVITLLGLNLPTTPEEAKDSNEGRLASGIFFLLTDFIRRVMEDDTSVKPKTLVIDEAWAVISSKAGAQTIKKVSLLGRSKDIAMILVTQSPKHLEGLDIESTIKTRFAFNTSKNEARKIIEDMNLPIDEGFENIITNLERGECLMQDWRDKYSTIKITSWKKDWAAAFATNPLQKRLKKIQEEKSNS